MRENLIAHVKIIELKVISLVKIMRQKLSVLQLFKDKIKHRFYDLHCFDTEYCPLIFSGFFNLFASFWFAYCLINFNFLSFIWFKKKKSYIASLQYNNAKEKSQQSNSCHKWTIYSQRHSVINVSLYLVILIYLLVCLIYLLILTCLMGDSK